MGVSAQGVALMCPVNTIGMHVTHGLSQSSLVADGNQVAALGRNDVLRTPDRVAITGTPVASASIRVTPKVSTSLEDTQQCAL